MKHLQTTLVKMLHVAENTDRLKQESLYSKAASMYGASSAVAELAVSHQKGILQPSEQDYSAIQASSQFISLAKQKSIIGKLEATGANITHLPLNESLTTLDLAPCEVIAQAYPTKYLNESAVTENIGYTLDQVKLGGFVVVPDQYLKRDFEKVEPLLNTALINSYVAGENAAVIDMLTDGVTPDETVASDFLSVLQTPLNAMPDMTQAVLMMHPSTALALAKIHDNEPLGVNGGYIKQVPVITDKDVTANQVIVLDASQLVLPSNASVQLRMTDEANIKDMTDDVLPLWQHHKTAIMVLANTGFSLLGTYAPTVLKLIGG